MKAVKISIAGETLATTPGAKRGRELIALTQLTPPEQLVFEVSGDVDIPVGPNDIIVIRGGEQFSIGDGSPTLPDNPTMRHPTGATLDERPLASFGSSRRGKTSVAELLQWAGGGELDIWMDLDGLSDELLEPTDRIVVQPADHFISVARETEDRLYEVTVLVDGDRKSRRFPAAMTVQQATRRSLAPRDRPNASNFEMVDGDVSDTALDPNLSLRAAGVRDGHTLSVTKKNGGGG